MIHVHWQRRTWTWLRMMSGMVMILEKLRRKKKHYLHRVECKEEEHNNEGGARSPHHHHRRRRLRRPSLLQRVQPTWVRLRARSE